MVRCFEGNEREVHCLRPYSSAQGVGNLSLFARAFTNVGLGRVNWSTARNFYPRPSLSLTRRGSRRALSREIWRARANLDFCQAGRRDAIFKFYDEQRRL